MMLSLTLKGARAHKRRMISTVAAIVIGVAFLAGSLVQVSTMQRTFDDLFAAGAAKSAAIVRSSASVSGDNASQIRPRFDATTLAKVQAVPGVRVAEPDVSGPAVIVGSNGKAVSTAGPPQLGMTWFSDPDLNPYRIASGRAPRTADEVVIDQRSADVGNLRVGERITVLTPDPTQLTLTGIATFGHAESAGGLTAALFNIDGAQQHLRAAGKLDEIRVAAAPGVSQAEIANRIGTVLPKGVEAVTGKQAIDDSQDIGRSLVGFLRPVLLTFALIALLVGAFSIYNTFNIVVAQRTRESALLRAIGASRRQTLFAVFGEAAIIGVVASALGVAVGLGLGAGLNALMSTGLHLPSNGLAISVGALVAAWVVGVVVTMASAIVPALKASRVKPMAALRDVSLDRVGASKARTVTGILMVAVAGATIAYASAGEASRVPLAGLGGLLAIVGAVVIAPVLARPVSRVLGAPVARLRGVSGNLARENAMRNPRRTASTASALMIGVAVVSLFTIIGATARHSVTTIVDRDFGGDLVVNADSSGGVSPTLARTISALPQVDKAAGIGDANLELAGESMAMTATDPAAIDGVLNLEVSKGSLQHMGPDGLAVSGDYAAKKHWTVGTHVPVTYADGTSSQLTVSVLYGADDLMGSYFMSHATAVAHTPGMLDFVVPIGLKGGVSLDDGRTAVEQAAKAYPTATVQDRKEYTDSVASQINQVLVIVYGMLALSILIALIGIANTLSLSTYERTRELGLLRAVGQTRRQVRSMVRWESVLIATFGTVLGLGIGLGAAWGLLHSSADPVLTGFSIPTGQLAVVLVLGGLAGVVAALRPASRAAKLDPLQAIATD